MRSRNIGEESVKQPFISRKVVLLTNIYLSLEIERYEMTKLKLVAVLGVAVLGYSLSAPVSASADPYCSSFGMYSSCVEVPGYTTPTPAPPKPLPVWVCKSVYTAQFVTAVIPGPIPTFISRVVLVPSLACLWV